MGNNDKPRDKLDIKDRCNQFWPKNSTAASFLLVVSTYTTLLAIVDQASTKEAIKDANNQTMFNIDEEIGNVTVGSISKSLLWNCRDYSVTKNYYKGFYIALITILLLYVIFGMSKFCKCSEGFKSVTKMTYCQLLSDWVLRISLVFLLTSYEIDPWVCFHGPSSITYDEDTHEVDLKHPESVLIYQKVAVCLATVSGLLGWGLGMFVLEDLSGKNDGHSGKDRDHNQGVKDVTVQQMPSPWQFAETQY